MIRGRRGTLPPQAEAIVFFTAPFGVKRGASRGVMDRIPKKVIPEAVLAICSGRVKEVDLGIWASVRRTG